MYMKRVAVLLCALACVWSANAQFTLTPTGFVSDNPADADFYLIECPGQGAEDIFRAVAYFMESSFPFPWTQFNAIEPESFTVFTVVPDAVVDGRRPTAGKVYDMEFRWRVDIRDGMIRLWVPEIGSLSREKRNTVSFDVGVGIGTESVELPVVGRSFIFVSTNYLPGQTRRYRTGSSAIFNRKGKLKREILKASLEDYFNSMTGSLEKYLSGRNDEW